MSDQRNTPFTTQAAAPLSAPPERPISTDPSDAPKRILLNWLLLGGGLLATLFVGGLFL